jgi:hypothetical protein
VPIRCVRKEGSLPAHKFWHGASPAPRDRGKKSAKETGSFALAFGKNTNLTENDYYIIRGALPLTLQAF